MNQRESSGFFLTWSLTWTACLVLAFCAGVLAMVMPWAGEVFWLFDLASHARLQTILGFAVLTLLALATRRWWFSLAALAMVVVNGLPLWPYYAANPSRVEDPAAPELHLVVANLLTSNPDPQVFLDWVRKVNPDVLALQEIGNDWHQVLEKELKDWIHNESRVREDNFGMAIYSRLPLESVEWPTLVPGGPISARVTLRWQGRSIPMLVTHPIPPVKDWASEQRDDQIEALAQADWVRDELALLAGDLNATPWSMALDPLHATDLRDGRLGFGYLGTWPARLPAPVRIPIDHLWVGPGWCVRSFEVGPNIHSDHLPLAVALSFGSLR